MKRQPGGAAAESLETNERQEPEESPGASPKMNKLETHVLELLGKLGFTGIEAQVKRLPGTPDFVHEHHKLAFLVNGSFWHSRRNSSQMATHALRQLNRGNETAASYWLGKEEANRKRDLAAKRELRKLGYLVIVLWEDKLQRGDALHYVGKTIAYAIKSRMAANK